MCDISAQPVNARSKRIAGICRDAEALGVTRGHLWAVLKGKRESVPLLKRYTDLKQNQAKPQNGANA